MAHEITITNGKAEAMFAGEKPWHRLGTMVDALQTPHDAVRIAEMDYEVGKKPIQIVGGEVIEDRVAVVRLDTGAYLSTVGKNFQLIQIMEQADFIAGLVGTGEAVVECVGSLKGGRKTFWTCKLPGNMVIGDADEIEKYLILCNAHDGTLAFRAFYSPIRVVCQNTLNAALGSAKGVCYYHSLNVMNRVNDARNILGLAESYYARLGENFQAMRGVGVDDETLKVYVEKVFPDAQVMTPGAMKSLEKTRAQVRTNFYQGVGADMAGLTVFGAYNAVTEYLDHQKWTKRTTADTRFESMMLGQVQGIQQKAFDVAMALVG